MKALITLIAAACLCGTALAQQPPAPPVENQQLAHRYGEWSYTGTTQTTPLGPGAKFNGTITGRPILNGYAAEFRANPSTPGESLNLCWYDPAAKSFRYLYLSAGYMEHGRFTSDDLSLSWEGQGIAGSAPFTSRGSDTMATDQQSFTRHMDISLDGSTWLPFLDTKYEKATPVAAERQLIQLEQDWAAAYVAGDVATLDRIEADTFTFTDPKGNVSTKADELADLRSKTYVATAFHVDDMKVALYGDAAVVTGRTTEKSSYKGEDTSGVYRWTDTWIKQNGTWRCVACQASRVPDSQ